ncbi:MAG: DoxX family protein [Acidobacteria bacterium]|nr:DoxX family protein [Acidobacteriota bacterium]
MTTTRGRKFFYWLNTVQAAFALAALGASDLVRVPAVTEGLAHLGYPAYFATILGVWKLLGVAAILAPGLPRLKEWAYAGMFFVLTGAAVSHAASGDPAGKILFPLMLLGSVIGSWALQAARGATVAAGAPAGVRVTA